MRVDYSKSFIKAASKLSGKLRDSLQRAVKEVKQANRLEEITDCKKLVGYNSVYRIRIGNHRVLFVCRIDVDKGLAVFEYLLPRGQVYSKEIKDALRVKDIKHLKM